MPYVQVYEGRRYILVAVTQLSFDSVTNVKGADVYDTQGNYKGYWARENFPPQLELRLLEYVRRTNVHLTQREFNPKYDKRRKEE